MQNKAYIYHDKQVVITSVIEGVGIDGEYVEIYLDNGQQIETHLSGIRMKIAEFKPLGRQVVVVANKALESVSSFQPNVIGSLRDTLLDTIKEVRSDPGKIEQAKAVNACVNSMIGLAKAEIEFRKLMNTEKKYR